MGKLAGKIAVITGGTSGIGFATAQRFVAEGAYVFITGRRQAELDAAVQRIGHQVTGVQGDVASLLDLDRLYATVQQQQGHLDILFANAGGGEFAPLGAITEAHFDKTFNANVKGLLFTVQKALPLLVDGSSIILNASTAASTATPAFSVYSATKAAVRSFARSWTLDLQHPTFASMRSAQVRRKPRVCTVSPRPRSKPKRCAASSARSRSGAWRPPTRSPRRPCSWPPTTAATSPASNSSSMAAWPKSNRSTRSTGGVSKAHANTTHIA